MPKNKVSAIAEKIVQYSGRVRLPAESEKSSPENRQHDKLLVAEILWLRQSLLVDLDCDLSATAYGRALMSLTEIDAKALFTDFKNLRSLSTSSEFRDAVVGNPNLAFKQLRRTVHYRWTVTSFPEMWDSNSVTTSYAKWIQWVSFDSRLNLVSADYSESLYTEYLCDEYAMSQWEYDSSLIREMNQVIREWTDGYYPEVYDFHGRPPSGATRELRRREVSPVTALALTYKTPQIAEYFDSMYGFDPDMIHRVLPAPYGLPEIPPMKMSFVPKSPLTNRMISIDTSTMLLVQKDLDYRLREWLKAIPPKCDLTDQDKSRAMAMHGSRFGEFDTLDISKCSDSVTVTLVEGLYHGTPWLKPLMLTRNPRVSYKRFLPLSLEKFAPMGSSTCFPVETSVLLAACEVAVRRTLGRRGTSKDYRVYGDDTVIRHDCTEELLRILEMIHLEVNAGKSFVDRSELTFREACGMEAVNGRDISPVRVSRFQRSALSTFSDEVELDGRLKGTFPSNPGAVVSLVDFCNRLLLANLPVTRRRVLELFPRRRWFYEIHRVDRTDYLRAIARGTSCMVGIDFPTPTFIVPDGTATDYGLRTRRSSSYVDPAFRPRSKLALVVKPVNRTTAGVLGKLSELGSLESPDDLAYHYWSLCSNAQAGSDGRCDADGVGVVERLNYFGHGSDLNPLSQDPVIRDLYATMPLKWDRKELNRL